MPTLHAVPQLALMLTAAYSSKRGKQEGRGREGHGEGEGGEEREREERGGGRGRDTRCSITVLREASVVHETAVVLKVHHVQIPSFIKRL